MLTFIINPTAGGGRAKRVEAELRAELERRGVAYEMLHTTAINHAVQLSREAAARADCEAVISVGGDGTTFEVATGLKNTGKPLGIIPAGTGNDFIKSVGLPANPLQALDFILTHTPRPVDLGQINDRCFLNVCGTGFDVTVLEQAALASKKLRGMLPYLYGVIRAIALFEPVHVAYELNGQVEERDVLLLSVANGRYIGGGIPICPAAEPTDGLLDVVMVDVVPRWKIPFYLPALLTGQILRMKISHHTRCTHLQVMRPGMRMQIDGEICVIDKAVFDIYPGGVQLYW